VAARDDYLIDTLVDMGLVTDEQLGPIRQEADSTGEGLVDTLVAKKIISARQVAQAKASQFGVEFVNLGEMRLPDDVISAVSSHVGGHRASRELTTAWARPAHVYSLGCSLVARRRGTSITRRPPRKFHRRAVPEQ